jgi:hypothetical protein
MLFCVALSFRFFFFLDFLLSCLFLQCLWRAIEIVHITFRVFFLGLSLSLSRSNVIFFALSIGFLSCFINQIKFLNLFPF